MASPAQPEPRRPLIRYHGGKWKLAPWILQHLPPHHTYVEPFGGGGSVLLRKDRSYAEVYNDLDDDVVNLFRVARDQGARLRRALELTPFARSEFELSYETTADPFEQARRMVVRAFQGFGSAAACGEKSGFRSTSSRSGTTPAMDWRNYPDALAAITGRLQGVVIENRDAKVVMAHHDRPATLHYVDPPYVHSTRSSLVRHNSHGKSYRHEMSDDAHRELAVFLRGLVGMVVLSGYESPLYADLLGDWLKVETQSHADGARPRIECLWLNPSAAARLKQPSLALVVGQ